MEQAVLERPNVARHVALLQALDQGQWAEGEIRQVAERIRDQMIADDKWRPTRKKPQRDKDHKRTLKLIQLLGGERG